MFDMQNIFRILLYYEQLCDNIHIFEGIKEPLIIVTPNKNQVTTRSPKTEDSLVSLLDVMPTILDWHGMSIPANLTGKSLLPYTGKVF